MKELCVFFCERCGDYNIRNYNDDFRCRGCGGGGNELVGYGAEYAIDAIINTHRENAKLTDHYDILWPPEEL